MKNFKNTTFDNTSKYLRYGERTTFSSNKSESVPVPSRSTCAAREPWYDLTGLVKPGLGSPKTDDPEHAAEAEQALAEAIASVTADEPPEDAEPDDGEPDGDADV